MWKKYRVGFDVWGLIVFLLVMLPTLIWSAFPAPNDILRAESVTGAVDTVGSICQALMVCALCMLIRKDRQGLRLSKPIAAAVICCVVYFACWICYYQGMTNAAVVLGLTLPPCMVFYCFALERKNGIAMIPIAVFTVCHLVYGVVNFIA